MHKRIEPAIHYWGTPVVLVSTLNEDGSVNVAPMSSAWWLGWSCTLPSDEVRAPRVAECPVQLEAVVSSVRAFGAEADAISGGPLAFRRRSALLSHERRRCAPRWPAPAPPSSGRYVGFGSVPLLVRELESEFPEAQVTRMPQANEGRLQDWLGALNQHLRGEAMQPQVPLDVRGTAFQMRGPTLTLPEGAARRPPSGKSSSSR